MKFEREEFKGVWTAVVTPFLEDGVIDWDAFEVILKDQMDAGVTGVVVCGTTGESPTLSVQEKLSLFRKTKAVLGDKVKVMAGTGGNNTEQSVELSYLAAEAGVDALLIVTPPYNKPSLDGLIAHFNAIAKKVELPLCLYHVPGRTAHKLSAQEISAVAEHDSVKMVKEASGDLALFARSNYMTNTLFLSGDDPTFLPSLAAGGHGCISVVSNVFPRAMVKMYSSWQNGDFEDAQAINRALLPFIDALFCETNPCPLKAAMNVMQFCKNTLRLPLVPVGEQNYVMIEKLLKDTTAILETV